MHIKFAICILSEGCDDLESLKVYRILPDEKAGKAGCLRVIDESGEDYLYPTEKFVVVEFSDETETRLMESIGMAA